jgi:hypothetical protein
MGGILFNHEMLALRIKPVALRPRCVAGARKAKVPQRKTPRHVVHTDRGTAGKTTHFG